MALWCFVWLVWNSMEHPVTSQQQQQQQCALQVRGKPACRPRVLAACRACCLTPQHPQERRGRAFRVSQDLPAPPLQMSARRVDLNRLLLGDLGDPCIDLLQQGQWTKSTEAAAGAAAAAAAAKGTQAAESEQSGLDTEAAAAAEQSGLGTAEAAAAAEQSGLVAEAAKEGSVDDVPEDHIGAMRKAVAGWRREWQAADAEAAEAERQRRNAEAEADWLYEEAKAQWRKAAAEEQRRKEAEARAAQARWQEQEGEAAVRRLVAKHQPSQPPEQPAPKRQRLNRHQVTRDAVPKLRNAGIKGEQLIVSVRSSLRALAPPPALCHPTA